MENNYNELQENELTEVINEPKKYRYAGFWMRLWAFLLDGIVIYSVNGLITYPLLRLLDLSRETIWFFSIAGVLTALVGFIYFTLMTKWFSQTLGKQLFGLKVIQVSGESLSWKTVMFREVVGRYLHYPFFPLKLLYLIIPFSSRKQGLHDRIADTFVIHEER
ncbi:RDD family protein [Alkalihalobacterium alkalinitrilicum]|uniref:RDD family protein n=1 Tax=Alkalihalobacterium alkalinitrilicum TaxID=427920 RepID=UPI0009957CF9|nr:RDD family protein [Alkalihalobacterium alkalinitrilicum]